MTEAESLPVPTVILWKTQPGARRPQLLWETFSHFLRVADR